ncbi:MAG TPA: hypothetical protein PLL53_21320, partial [Saprospiraceae bacterium]|nr:hypothetical protein [Saprospiraceae bacterium]
ANERECETLNQKTLNQKTLNQNPFQPEIRPFLPVNPKSEIRNQESGIRNPKSGIRNRKSEIRNPKPIFAPSIEKPP